MRAERQRQRPRAVNGSVAANGQYISRQSFPASLALSLSLSLSLFSISLYFPPPLSVPSSPSCKYSPSFLPPSILFIPSLPPFLSLPASFPLQEHLSFTCPSNLYTNSLSLSLSLLHLAPSCFPLSPLLHLYSTATNLSSLYLSFPSLSLRPHPRH